MPLMTLNRDYALASLAGRSINFEKNKPVWVPPEVVKEALQIGAQGVEEQLDILDPAKPPKEELNAEEREQSIFNVFTKLVERNGRGDFTASGVPNTKVMESLLGFEVAAKERDRLWDEFKKAKEVEAAEEAAARKAAVSAAVAAAE
jgi:hypothetical protein